jgi:5'-deoxynucleotidase YfbR-like HD superfamily hydrolase
MTLLSEVERRLKALRAELEEARKAASEAKRREEEIATTLAAYERVLQAEQRSQGIETAGNSVAYGENKAAVIRGLLQRSQGANYREIRELLRQRGMAFSPNYPYTLVSKWKERGHVREEDGRLYWKQEMTAH